MAFTFSMENKADIATTQSHTFSKEERLCSKKLIDRLFSEGQSFLAYPVKVVFLPTELPTSSPVQAGFTASKKNFKRAVKRNRIKRLMREAYRLHKHELYRRLNERQLAVFFIFIGKDVPDYPSVEAGIGKAFDKLIKQLEITSGTKS